MSGASDDDEEITYLEDKQILEISPVRRPATRRKKLFQKSGDDPMNNEQKKALAPYCKASGMPAEDMYKAFAKMSDEERDKVLKGLAKMCEDRKKEAEAKTKAEKAKAEALEVTKGIKEKLKEAHRLVADDEAEKALPLLNELTGTEERFKSEDLPPAARRAYEKAEARAKAAEEKAEETAKRLEAREKAEARRSWKEKAEALEAHPGEKIGDLLADIAEKGGKDLAERVRVVMKAADAAIAEGALYEELGSGHEGGPKDGSAEAELEAKARGIREKSSGELTDAQAYTIATRRYPDLYRKMRQEQAAQ